MTEMVKVSFSGGDLWAIEKDGQVWVPISYACQALGLDERSQRKRLAATPWGTCRVVTTRHPGDNQDRETACLNLDAFPMWLATISIKRVAPELRERLAAYQCEAARVLRNHFFGSPNLEARVTALEEQVRKKPLRTIAPSDDLVAAIVRFMAGRTVWDGPASELLEQLGQDTSPAALSAQLGRAAPALASHGIVARRRRSNGQRRMRLSA